MISNMMRTFDLENCKIHQANKGSLKMLEQINKGKKKFTPMTEQEILSSKRERQRTSQAKRKSLNKKEQKKKFTPMTKKGDLVLQKERQRISMR